MLHVKSIISRLSNILVPVTNSIKIFRCLCVKAAEENTNAAVVPDSAESSVNAGQNFIPPPFLKLPPRTFERKKQNYDYFLVLDFEATCDSPITVVPQVIINFC